jgi:biopolymer transport protein ExbD
MIRRFKRRRKRSYNVGQEISLTPLIDTALTLLIIFMVAAPMVQNSIRITLPQGKAQEAGNAQQDLVVYVDANSKIFLNGKPVADESLIQSIQAEIGKDQERTVFVKGDVGASYGKIIELVDQIKVVGGVKYVALATQKRA